MLKLQYDLNNSPINIYVDRPNKILEQLTDINVRFFVIGKYEEQEKNFVKVEYITPDIKPALVLSQNKLQNFDIMFKFAQDHNVPFLHYENSGMPDIHKAWQLALKGVRANINVFTSISIVRDWEFDEAECVVIPIGIKLTDLTSKKLYHISNELPIFEMANGICPIVLKTPMTSSIITNAYNGFLYQKESDASIIADKLSKMEVCDVQKIGQNAKNTIKEKLPYDPFINSWKKLLRSII